MKKRHSPAQSWIQPTLPLTAPNVKTDSVSYTERITRHVWTDHNKAEAPISLLSPGAVPRPGGQAAVPQPAARGAAQARPGRAAPRPGAHRLTPRAEVTRSTRLAGRSRPAPCQTSTHYPCCSALRIEAQLAARAAHFPAPAAPRSAPQPSSATRGWRRHHRAGQVWPGPSVKAGPCLRRLSCVRAQRSRQRQILQLLQLAQAASDYLKPQPFFYARRAQTLDRSICTCSDGSRDHRGNTALSLKITELFLAVSSLPYAAFTLNLLMQK